MLTAAATWIPYPHWLVPGDNTWQLVAATLVGLMSLPGIAVLYGGLVQRKWVVNTMLMAFAGFSLVLLVWVLWGYNMAFGTPAHWGATGSFFGDLIGKPGLLTNSSSEQSQAVIPLITAGPPFHFPAATLGYFQFVFAAITPLLFLGGILGRMKFKAWLLFVPLWITFCYCVNAFLIWGGGFFAQKGALDYSGGYVIHLAAGVTAFTLAAIVGPRLARDRTHAVPNNLMLVAVGAGILWLGWNGFNGGDPYYAGADASSAVLNTNIATATALLVWMFMDMLFSREHKPTFLGAINGMICGLVGITPSAGWVNGFGAMIIGLVCSAVVWVAWNYLSKVKPFSKVDDALGVVYTHGIAGLLGGLLVGLLVDPNMVEYIGVGKTPNISFAGLFYGGGWHQEWEQFITAVWVIVFTAIMTTILAYLVKFICRGLREKDEVLEIGDVAIHDEEVYPQETFAERVSAMSSRE